MSLKATAATAHFRVTEATDSEQGVSMAKPRKIVPKATEAEASVDAANFAKLEEKYRRCKTAFQAVPHAQNRTDDALYAAIGQLAEFAAASGNDRDVLMKFAGSKGMKFTNASPVETIVATLIAPNRKSAYKYSCVLRYAALYGDEPSGTKIAAFIKSEGGVEVCVSKYREERRKAGTSNGKARPTVLDATREKFRRLPSIAAPDELREGTPGTFVGEFFLLVGHRSSDGEVRMLRDAETDEKLVGKIVSRISKARDKKAE